MWSRFDGGAHVPVHFFLVFKLMMWLRINLVKNNLFTGYLIIS